MCAPSMPLLPQPSTMLSRVAPHDACLDDFDVGHAVFGEQALLLGDHQRRRIHQRDVAEDRLRHLRVRRLARMRRRREIASAAAPSSAAVPAVAFRKVRRLRPSGSCVGIAARHVVVLVAFGPLSPCVPVDRQQKSRSPSGARLCLPRSAALLVGPSLDRRCRRSATAPSRLSSNSSFVPARRCEVY